MNLQIIKSVEGNDEYVLLPIALFHAMRESLAEQISQITSPTTPFEPEQYTSNAIALARVQAGLTQGELALRMGVSQAYVSKIETQKKLTAKLLHKVKQAIEKD